ncbi:Glycosyl transferase, family 35 [Corchorus olitorius]|uniref:Alpha-1,4 glucan phosphorylase n=1 Tax=Corchorus olitorius TaxID=93759 RepID=A0A1R3GWT2_9ROSI|nr:Glycosyl transferase, family 35 [Corchorus olitorius]
MMEYLQGRALNNAIGNLSIQDAYADALNKLGHELEDLSRHDVVFLVRFFGDVEVNPDGTPMWEAKACAEDFNLFQFNDGQYESAAQLNSRAQQICVVLYPGDATENGKLLRPKQQFFLCSASLRAAVQLNDTHPTLAIPELVRLLMDDEGLGWDEAWDVTTRTNAYTNHTVLSEEKWSQPVMLKLLPRHMEIIEEIDKRFLALINATRPDLGHKLPSMRILDHNPQKPVVTMANLCVVSSHAVSKPQQTFPQECDYLAWEQGVYCNLAANGDVNFYETLDNPAVGKKIGFATFVTGIVHGLQPVALMK